MTLFARDTVKGCNYSMFRASHSPPRRSADYDLVVNAPTPVITGHAPEQLSGARWVYDLVYNPIETQLLSEARKAGCETLGGLEMLVAQAKIQFELWTGIRPLNR